MDEREIIMTYYNKAYDEIQSLGSSGFHNEIMITRQQALNALKLAHNKMLDKLEEK
jgi:hypothetical protein